MISQFIAVFVGGGLGSVSRLLFSFYFNGTTGNTFPTGTLLANGLSSLLLGFLAAYFLQKSINENVVLLFKNGNSTTAFAYLALSLFIGLLAIFMGFKIGEG